MFSQVPTISSSKASTISATLSSTQGRGSELSNSNHSIKLTVQASDFNSSVKKPSSTRLNESLLSRSLGGSTSDFEALRQSSNALQGITHSGYLLKRSNNPYVNPKSDEGDSPFENEVGPISAPIRIGSSLAIGSSPPSPPKTHYLVRSKTLAREIPIYRSQSHNNNNNNNYLQVPSNNNNNVDYATFQVTDKSHSRLFNSVIGSDSSLSSDCFQDKNINAAFDLAAAFFGDDDGAHKETPPPLPDSSDHTNGTKMLIPSVIHDPYPKVASSSLLVPPSNDSILDKRIMSPYHRNEIVPTANHNHENFAVSENIPSDVIDPKDGHIWRSKYCVLEEGVLYFYRNFHDGNSNEARLEREQGVHQYSAYDRLTSQHSDHVLHTNYNENDIAKSPMPRNPNFFTMMNEQTKSGSIPSNFESVPIWEKRVALEKVGVVRSAQFEYGDFSFILVATDCDDNPNSLDKKEVNPNLANTDRLILRASNTDEMNDWLFQFHRSLIPFMKNFVNMAGSSGNRAGKRKENMFRGNRLMDSHQYYNPTLPILMPSNVIPIATSKSKAFSSDTSTALSLSHGHGRTGFHRRRVQEKPTDPINSPSSTPGGGSSPLMSQGLKYPKIDHDFLFQQSTPSNLNARADLIEQSKKKSKPFQLGQLLLQEDNFSHFTSQSIPVQQLESKKQSKKMDKIIPNNKDTNKDSQRSALSKQIDKTPGLAKNDLKPSTRGKYTAPHLRKNTTKYVPPHLRNRGSSGKNENKLNKKSGTPDKTNKNLRSNDAGSLKNGLNSKSGQRKESSTKLGGCADPTIVVGSVLDGMHKSRKGPKVGKVRSRPYGYDTNKIPPKSVVGGEENHKTNLFWEVGAISECGIRDSNEDSFLIINDLINVLQSCGDKLDGSSSESFPKAVKEKLDFLFPDVNKLGLFAIFDGHLGNQAARFAAEKLPFFITKSICVFDPDQTLSTVQMMEKILASALLELDKSFCRICVEDGRDWECGATVLIGIVMDASIIVAHLGDSSGVLCGAMQNSKLSESQNDTVQMTKYQDVLKKSGWSILNTDENDIGANLSSQLNTENDDKSVGIMGQETSTNIFWKEIVDIHCPARVDERKRIEAANGWITTETEIPISQLQRMDLFDDDVVDILKRCFSDRFNLDNSTQGSKKGHAEPGRLVHISRICGELAVSRALGDRDFKAASNLPQNGNSKDCEDLTSVSWEGPFFLQYAENHSRRFIGDVVSPVPETHTFQICANGFFDEFLLLACDGLWDVMDADDAVRVTRSLLFDNGWSTKKAAARLAELAMHLGSSDNITVIVIYFRQSK